MVAFDGRIVVLSLRIAQAILAIIVLALTAYGTVEAKSHVANER